MNYFRNEKNCKIVAYECYDLLNRAELSWYKKYFWKIGSKFYLKTFKIFKFFGTDKFIKPTYNNKINFEAEKIANSFFKKNPSLKELENFKIKDIWIGDLIYDSYLKKYSLTSIEMESINFIKFFKNSIKLYLFWYNFFKKNKVEGICACHAVYLTGIPLRIANNFNINCFSISSINLGLINISGKISYVNKINGTDIQFKYYKKILKKLSNKNKKIYLEKGKKILEDYSSGKKKYFYLKKPTSTVKSLNIKNIKRSKIKVVIFTHDFIDSPHIYGNHLFYRFFKNGLNFSTKSLKVQIMIGISKNIPHQISITSQEIYKLKRIILI